LSNQHIARHPSSPILVVKADKHSNIRAEKKMKEPSGSIQGSNRSLEAENEMHTRRDNWLTLTKNQD
jgi:hypothetical protein